MQPLRMADGKFVASYQSVWEKIDIPTPVDLRHSAKCIFVPTDNGSLRHVANEKEDLWKAP